MGRELTQEAYVDQMEFAAVPGKGSDPVEPRVMRAHCGQLCYPSHSRPDQAFLAVVTSTCTISP